MFKISKFLKKILKKFNSFDNSLKLCKIPISKDKSLEVRGLQTRSTLIKEQRDIAFYYKLLEAYHDNIPILAYVLICNWPIKYLTLDVNRLINLNIIYAKPIGGGHLLQHSPMEGLISHSST